MANDEYEHDEMALLPDNAAEVGLAWTGPPVVRRQAVTLPDGRSLSALVWGDASPEIALVHGGAQNAHTWDTMALALGRPVIAVDLPGHGHSDWRPDHDYQPAVLAEDVAVALAALAPSIRLLVGMSLGGLTSLALAARHPEQVPRLLLVDITPGVNAEKSKAILEFVSGPERFDSFEQILQRTIDHNPGRSESSLRRGVTHNARRQDDGSWTWRWDPVRSMGVDGGNQVRFDALWDDLAAVSAPLTLVRGSRSPVVDDQDVLEVLARKPDAEILSVEDAGHSIQGDQPLELARIIDERA